MQNRWEAGKTYIRGSERADTRISLFVFATSRRRQTRLLSDENIVATDLSAYLIRKKRRFHRGIIIEETRTATKRTMNMLYTQELKGSLIRMQVVQE